MSKFYSLKVQEIDSLTVDSVKITFADYSTDVFKFISGQYITLRQKINNQEVRRSYSLSSQPGNSLEIGVKRIENGLMSTFLTKELKVGDYIDVMEPCGNFYLESKGKGSHYVGICAGSGITPILSMIKDVIQNEPDSYFTLIFGNQRSNSVMFAEDLRSLENNFQSQLFIHYFFSRENIADCIKGRIDNNSLENLCATNSILKDADSYFLCGPGEMIDNVSSFLLDLGIEESKVHFERFYTDSTKKEVLKNRVDDEIISNVTVSVDGDDFSFELSSKGATILDAAMNAGADVPFSCKGGVCCVCKAKVIEGKVMMDQNYSLSEDEVKEGYVLTCQSHPNSENVIIDFDEV